LKKERSAQETMPMVHMRNVHTGSVGSSVVGTVSRTCSTSATSPSSSSPTAATLRLGCRSISIVVAAWRASKALMQGGGLFSSDLLGFRMRVCVGRGRINITPWRSASRGSLEKTRESWVQMGI
jgi:hypothetical protein